MQEHATALADAIDAALPGWVRRSVASRVAAGPEPEGPSGPRSGRQRQPVDRVEAAAAEAGERARAEIGARIRALLHADIDDQRTTPLALLRSAVSFPTAVLAAAGVPPVPRDRAQRDLFPDDVYDLNPATFADVDPALAGPGMAWGAAKAWTHLQRHQPEPSK
ncbi:MAG: hypothetical protein ACR2HV_10180 [Acidimicrobiales bacterium]